MNWITTVAMVVLFAVNLVACGRSDEPTPVTQAVTAAREVVRDNSSKKEDRKLEAERKKRDEESRRQIVEEVRLAFELTKGPERDQFGRKSPDWTKELEAASTVGAKTCANSEKFNEMTRALGYLTPGHEVVTLEEIGASVNVIQEVTRRYRKLGLAVASSFVEVFKMPLSARAKIQCGRGEGSFDLADTDRVMRVVVNALAEINETPTAIKQTPNSLRAMLQKDFTERLAEIRKDIKEGRASESDGMGNFLYVAREAIGEWKFSPEEIKLTRQEVVAYSDYRRRW